MPQSLQSRNLNAGLSESINSKLSPYVAPYFVRERSLLLKVQNFEKEWICLANESVSSGLLIPVVLSHPIY